jgi:hypothetical protein
MINLAIKKYNIVNKEMNIKHDEYWRLREIRNKDLWNIFLMVNNEIEKELIKLGFVNNSKEMLEFQKNSPFKDFRREFKYIIKKSKYDTDVTLKCFWIKDDLSNFRYHIQIDDDFDKEYGIYLDKNKELVNFEHKDDTWSNNKVVRINILDFDKLNVEVIEERYKIFLDFIRNVVKDIKNAL